MSQWLKMLDDTVRQISQISAVADGTSPFQLSGITLGDGTNIGAGSLPANETTNGRSPK